MATAGSTPALRFSLIGFPIRIDVSFVVLLALLGFGLSFHHLLLWVGIATAAVLAHELGHALAARAIGASATISLEGLSGLTRPRRATPFSRREDALVSAAGPAVGLLLGAATVAAWAVLRWEVHSTGGFVLTLVLFTTAGWSLLNLLPILPLDGGHLLVAALPGSAPERQLKAARVSVAVAALGAFAAYRAGWTFSILFAAMLGAQNLAMIKRLQQQVRYAELSELYGAGRYGEVVDRARAAADDMRLPLDDRARLRCQLILALVAADRYHEARSEMERCPERAELGAAFRGYVIAATGDPGTGVALARRAVADEPSGESVWWCFEAQLRTGHRDGAAAVLEAHADLLYTEQIAALRTRLADYRPTVDDWSGQDGDSARRLG